MIPNATEIATSLYGAWRLAWLDRAGSNFFNATDEGFWRSFFAAVLVAPGHIVLLMMGLAEEPQSTGLSHILAVQGFAYVIAWTSFPLVMFYLARNLDRSADYMRYIVAYNWAQVLEILFYLPVLALVESGVLADSLASLLDFAAKVAILGYEWFIAVAVLRLSRFPAAGVVFVALALNILISVFAHAMIR